MADVTVARAQRAIRRTNVIGWKSVTDVVQQERMRCREHRCALECANVAEARAEEVGRQQRLIPRSIELVAIRNHSVGDRGREL